MSDILFGDFETRSPVDIMASGADVYARDPNARVMAFGYAFDDDDVLVNPIGAEPEPAIVDHVGEQKTFVAHNAPFEWLIWNYVYRKEFPDLPKLEAKTLVCTMSLGYAMSLPGKLEKMAPAAGIDLKKDMEGHRIMLQLSQPKTFEPLTWYEPDEFPEKFKRMYQYCATDIAVERALYKRLLKLSPKEKELWVLDHKINQRGVGVDLVAVENAIELVKIEKARLDVLMQEVTDNAVGACSAVKQLTEWLRYRGVKCDGVAKNDVADILADPLLPEDCRRALELRQEAAKSSTAKLPAILRGVCDDGRIRGLFQYHGAGTGRWAGRRIQLQNLPRPQLKQKQIEDVFQILRSI